MMPYLKISMFKAHLGDFVDKYIAFMTGSKHSHVEIIFPDGISFSASPKKTRGFVHSNVPKDSYLDKCDIYNIYVTDKQLLIAREFCEKNCLSEHREKDDYLGFIEYLLCFPFSKNRWHCVRFATDLLNLIFDKKFTRLNSFGMTPNKLQKAIITFLRRRNSGNIKKKLKYNYENSSII
jgi:hypothetical protein